MTMDKPYLHFAHANGFPAPVYRKLLERLGRHYQVGYLETIGHDSRYPVTDGWRHLRDETIAHIERSYPAPVIGVGHSLGGVLLFLAAVKRPELFRALVILDSPLFSPWRARGLQFAKLLGFMDRITPAAATLHRRNDWGSVEEVRQYFAGKRLFARFDPDCLADYARYGTVEQRGRRKLRFSPQIECMIFRSLPHHYARLRGRLRVPLSYIAGTETDVVSAADLAHLKRHFHARLYRQRGSHLYPFEAPLETADTILEAIADLTATIPAA
jgi:pimeloyl-ACP methyl ester carboxylesterase